MEKEELDSRFQTLCSQLMKEQNSNGFWSGKLSSSALSTAIAIVALKINGSDEDDEQIRLGYNWLCNNINTDGGFGDTTSSDSNVSTSLICYGAINYCQSEKSGTKVLAAIESYLLTKNIRFTTEEITSSILEFYGKDYTFSVPILSLLIICGVLTEEAANHIPQLPFELSLLPQALYRFFNMQVVSYAIPALIGVGIFIHICRKTRFPVTKSYRNIFINPAIRKLTSIMPESGGFLEAIPLTGFVCMCLSASGKAETNVVKKGTGFLRAQQRGDGSWPIDTDLSTWVTTLSIKALGPRLETVIPADNLQLLKSHLLSVQYKSKHPFNGAKPGGWGWTNFTGSVPDADDTPGAILALLELYQGNQQVADAVIKGCNWLVDIQNSDGGFPTFCKGWGKLPFDSSCADLSGHALLALISVPEKLGSRLPLSMKNRYLSSAGKAVGYLQKFQSPDGHWNPLWFGNQLTDDRKNPVYGTARVSVYLEDCLAKESISDDLRSKLNFMVNAGQEYLLAQQNPDGSWGGRKAVSGTIEETALAISALARTNREACIKGFEWLANNDEYNNLNSSPIGLYFAALWYDEKMYPLVFYIEALRRFLLHDEQKGII